MHTSRDRQRGHSIRANFRRGPHQARKQRKQSKRRHGPNIRHHPPNQLPLLSRHRGGSKGRLQQRLRKVRRRPSEARLPTRDLGRGKASVTQAAGVAECAYSQYRTSTCLTSNSPHASDS